MVACTLVRHPRTLFFDISTHSRLPGRKAGRHAVRKARRQAGRPSRVRGLAGFPGPGGDIRVGLPVLLLSLILLLYFDDGVFEVSFFCMYHSGSGCPD